MTARHTTRHALTALALACAMCAGTAHASGGYEPTDLFFSTARPDQPVREFVEHPAGYYIDNLVPYQVLWYWRLHGQAFPPEAVKTFTALLSQLPQEDGGMDDADAHWSVWRKARADAYAKLGHPLPATAQPAQPAPQFDADRLQATGTNCVYGDAMRNATQTLSQRMQRASRDKGDAPFVLIWLQAQDAVFDTCNDDKAATKMPALPANAPAWLKADGAWQRAAQIFYADDLDAADTAFEAIAADKSSEWRDLAAYMRLRVLARQNPGDGNQQFDDSKAGKETPDQLKAQAGLTQAVDALVPALLKNPRLQPLYPSIHRLAEALRVRYLLPDTRLQRLADQLKTMGEPDIAAARLLLLNHEFRFCAYGDCTVVGPDNRSDLIAWLSTVRDFGGHGTTDKWREKTSWSRYQRTHDLAWLMAAASLVPAAGTDDAREKELQAALAAVPEDSPVRFAATQLRAQRLYAQGRFKEARDALAGAAESPLIAHSASGQNLVKALLLPTAASEEEWRRLAIRPVVARRDPEALAPTPTAKDAAPLATALDDDVARFLNTRAPLSMWLRLSGDPRLSPALRDTLLETAWTRAVLAGDYANARRAAELRNASTPAPAKGVDPIAGLRRSTSLKDDAAAWQHLLLERMASASETLASPHWLAPAPGIIRTPLLPGRESTPSSGDYNGAGYTKWCRALGVETTGAKAAQPAEFAQPEWLPQAERAAQTALVAKLAKVPSDSIYFTQESLALMARDRADPLVPQALSVSVKMARYTCADKSVGEWSRKGLQTLHASYANTSWAANTQYWFSGR